jgi:hypothetical protein
MTLPRALEGSRRELDAYWPTGLAAAVNVFNKKKRDYVISHLGWWKEHM